MLIVLSGKTCAGKSVVQTVLMQRYGCKKIVTYTTRPKREGEKDGDAYHFISKEEFLKKEEEGFFLECAKYGTLIGGMPDTWYYGSAREDYIRASEDDANYVVVLQQAGLKALKETHISYSAIYLDVTEETIYARQTGRKDNETEAKRRILADREAFRDIRSLVDASISVDDLSVDEAAKLVLDAADRLAEIKALNKRLAAVKELNWTSFNLNGGCRKEAV